jgi:hypothetical protein
MSVRFYAHALSLISYLLCLCSCWSSIWYNASPTLRAKFGFDNVGSQRTAISRLTTNPCSLSHTSLVPYGGCNLSDQSLPSGLKVSPTRGTYATLHTESPVSTTKDSSTSSAFTMHATTVVQARKKTRRPFFFMKFLRRIYDRCPSSGAFLHPKNTIPQNLLFRNPICCLVHVPCSHGDT